MFSLLFVLLFVYGQSVAENYHCIWYSECNVDDYTIRNCYYDGPGKVLLNATAQQIMLRRCPDIYQSGTYKSDT